MSIVIPDDSGAYDEGITAGPCAIWPMPVPWCCSVTGSPAVTGFAAEVATEVLWAASGRQFGTCQLTLRPCRESCGEGAGWLSDSSGYPWPALIRGKWVNVGCGACGGPCDCSTTESVLLPGPVATIIEVRIDGTVVPTGSFRVDDGRRLVRTDGGRWPLCQNRSLSAGQPGTWTITFSVGTPVPAAGRLAMGELVCELIQACEGGDCRLPRRVQDLTRAGVRITFSDVTSGGLIGLEHCDMFIQAFNPYGLAERAQVYSPDSQTWTRQTWPY